MMSRLSSEILNKNNFTFLEILPCVNDGIVKRLRFIVTIPGPSICFITEMSSKRIRSVDSDY